MTKFLLREDVLALFRRCLRSARSIQDVEKQMMYASVARESFRRRVSLPVNSREAYNAYRDGCEQVESMEYYQSVAKGVQTGTTSVVSMCPTNQITRSDFASQKGEVMGWIRSHIPLIRQPDLDKYSRRLVEDGFDSIQFIEQELALDDICFMKKAHRRVIARSLTARSEDGQ